VLAYGRKRESPFEIIVVNDGSRDRTAAMSEISKAAHAEYAW